MPSVEGKQSLEAAGEQEGLGWAKYPRTAAGLGCMMSDRSAVERGEAPGSSAAPSSDDDDQSQAKPEIGVSARRGLAGAEQP